MAHHSSQVWPFDTVSNISESRLQRETLALIDNQNLLDQLIKFAIKWCSPLFRQWINFLLYLSISFASLVLQSLPLSSSPSPSSPGENVLPLTFAPFIHSRSPAGPSHCLFIRNLLQLTTTVAITRPRQKPRLYLKDLWRYSTIYPQGWLPTP